MTFAILRASGNFPELKERFMISHKGIIIKSGIIFNNFKGMLCGPVDLFSRLEIISKTSSLDI